MQLFMYATELYTALAQFRSESDVVPAEVRSSAGDVIWCEVGERMRWAAQRTKHIHQSMAEGGDILIDTVCVQAVWSDGRSEI